MPLGPPSNRNETGTCKYFGDLLDAAGADPVGALLVFLNLLEGQAQCFAEFFLAHAQHDAAHAHTAADIFVNRIGRFGRHLQHSLGLRAGMRQNEKLMPAGAGTVKSCSEDGDEVQTILAIELTSLFVITVARMRMAAVLSTGGLTLP